MKRYGKKIHWDRKAIIGFSAALLMLFVASQVPNYIWVWPWGPSTGFRTAGLSNGHYERQYPAILRGMPLIGLVLVSGDERLIVDYDVTIKEGHSSFTIWKWPTIFNRPRNIGPRSIAASGTGRIEVVPSSLGIYQIYMHAHRIQGAVAVDWRTEATRRQRAGVGNNG